MRRAELMQLKAGDIDKELMLVPRGSPDSSFGDAQAYPRFVHPVMGLAGI